MLHELLISRCAPSFRMSSPKRLNRKLRPSMTLISSRLLLRRLSRCWERSRINSLLTILIRKLSLWLRGSITPSTRSVNEPSLMLTTLCLTLSISPCREGPQSRKDGSTNFLSSVWSVSVNRRSARVCTIKSSGIVKLHRIKFHWEAMLQAYRLSSITFSNTKNILRMRRKLISIRTTFSKNLGAKMVSQWWHSTSCSSSASTKSRRSTKESFQDLWVKSTRDTIEVCSTTMTSMRLMSYRCHMLSSKRVRW